MAPGHGAGRVIESAPAALSTTSSISDRYPGGARPSCDRLRLLWRPSGS